MSLKSFIVPRAAQKLLGEDRLNTQRAKFERGRMSNSEAHKVEFFHDPSDPYSQLLEKVLPRFAENYKIGLITHLVSPPDDAAAPERAKLTEYSKMDAMRLAKRPGLSLKFKITRLLKTHLSQMGFGKSSVTILARRFTMAASGIGALTACTISKTG